MRTLRQELRRWLVSRWMVKVNLLSPAVAAHHVRAMSADELRDRYRILKRLGMELSAAGPSASSGNAVSTEFLRPETATAGPRYSTAFPTLGPVMPEPRKRNSESRDQISTVAGRQDHPDGVGFGVASRV